ncbi:hypothetical protein [Streptomyces sp. NPDC006552]|uniref:hypothetical protein n=1 Tax=Streptomyces sp. NPDC006552 TaxID=3157179 RepID=UPI0033A5B920
MQMTESFAATVAAGAPVILLLGVVEIEQLRRRIKQGATSYEEWSARAIAILKRRREQGDSAPVSDEEYRELLARYPNFDVTAFALVQTIVWVAFCLSLLSVESLSLRWLAQPEGDESPEIAKYCALVLLLGFLWVMAVPLFRIRQILSRAARHASMAHGQISELAGAMSSDRENADSANERSTGR